MRTRYTQMEILMCLFDCKRHTISELQSKTGYSGSTIRRHLQELAIFLPIEIYRGSKTGEQGGGGVVLQKNYLFNILFHNWEIKLLIKGLEVIDDDLRAKELKEKLERLLGDD